MPKLTLQNRFALLTKHEKHEAIAPVLKSELQISLVSTSDFDTDTLGTFDGKVARKLTPVKSALKKAYLACELTGLSQGLGSEGSFNSHFLGGIEDEEILAFVDTNNKTEIVAVARQMINLGLITAGDMQELANKLSMYKQEHPAQKWMLKQGETWIKGIALKDIKAHIKSWPVHLEPDFRAMNCPSRQETISLATKDLVKRLTSECPQCESPNFVEKYRDKGPEFLPCELCMGPTTKAKAPSILCNECDYEEQNKEAAVTASPFYCTICNP